MESIASIHATALEICYTIYGELNLSSDAIDRFYESSAIYENPVLTATSRSVIFDIFKLGRRLHSVDIPQPLAVFYTLLRLKPPEDGSNPLLKALRVWNEVGDISEHESFDGHRKAVIEHTLNILVLPSIHIDSYKHAPFHRSALSTDSLVSRSSYNYHPASPSLPIPGTSLSLPSPFHFKLHVITRLSFNEQGHITNHRDYWDVKDLMGLLPGASLAHWILSRLAAKGLSYNSRFLTRISAHPHLHDSEPPTNHNGAAAENRDLVNGPMAYVKSAKQTYGH